MKMQINAHLFSLLLSFGTLQNTVSAEDIKPLQKKYKMI